MGAFVWSLAGLAGVGCTKDGDAAPSVAADRKEQSAPVAASAAPAATAEANGPGHSGGGARAGEGAKGEQGLGALGAAPSPQKAGLPSETRPGDGVGLLKPRPPSEVTLDPNGRFATTYRPGGGHLAAFESAVARGVIPSGERELVSDVGSRYTPPMDAPKDRALAFKADLERGKLSPSGGDFHLRIALRSTTTAPAARPHLSVHLVLDVSGSMAGASITSAREAAKALVEKLAPTDDFSLVTFSSDAKVQVPDGPVGSRLEMIKKTISDVHEGGGTNIGKGLELGYAEAEAKNIPEDAVRVVLLLSDGRANAGITSPDRLSKLALDAFQHGVQTSSFGLGADYDGALMSAIADDGAGGYYYLRDAEQISPALSTEIDKRLDPVATAVEVRVRLKKGVDLLHVYGSRRLTDAEAARVRSIEVAADQQAQKRDKIDKDRQDDTEGGMRFFIPAFARDDSHALLFKLHLPEGVGSKAIAMIELKYKDRVVKKNVSDELPVTASFADSDAASAATIDASVSRTAQGFAAGEALADASSRIASGDRSGAVAVLSEREGILRAAADALKEPLLAKDADRLARLREHAGTETGLGDPLVLAMLLETAGRSHLH